MLRRRSSILKSRKSIFGVYAFPFHAWVQVSGISTCHDTRLNGVLEVGMVVLYFSGEGYVFHCGHELYMNGTMHAEVHISERMPIQYG